MGASGFGVAGIFAVAAAACAALPPDTSASSAPPAPAWDTYSDTWVVTDGLNRPLPANEETGGPRPDRTVGIFYFLTLGHHGTKAYDNAKILAKNPSNAAFVPDQHIGWWGEPIWGYYLSNDRAVIRKELQMLADAGVDVLIFDNTNDLTYPDTAENVFEELEARRRLGERYQQVILLASTRSADRAYADVYGKNRYPELWFRWQGKPLLLVKNTDTMSADVQRFFTLRSSWAWSNPGGWFGDGRDKWPWLDSTPQQPGWHDSKDKPEEISVAIAQHATTTIGRSFHNGKEPPAADRHPEQGIYFTEQWQRALQVDPEFIFVTGWNEWTAGHYVSDKPGVFAGQSLPAGYSFFVDEYDPEFSRDAEPSKTVTGDNYYYQLAGYVRRYKGTRPLPPVTSKHISLAGPFAQWETVQPEFRDDIGDPVYRDSPGFEDVGYGGGPYVNQTGRNDIVAAKVSFDDRNITFYVRTKDLMTPPTGDNWMLLFLNTDHDYKTGWLGYDFVVDRIPPKDGKAFVERSLGSGYTWGKPMAVPCRIVGNEMMLSIPWKVLGLRSLPATIDFKWADNCIAKRDWTDFTLNGDAAPNDRFNYRATLPAGTAAAAK